MSECYKNKWSPTKEQCQSKNGKPSVKHLGNFTDEWTWCLEHDPQRGTGKEGE